MHFEKALKKEQVPIFLDIMEEVKLSWLTQLDIKDSWIYKKYKGQYLESPYFITSWPPFSSYQANILNHLDEEESQKDKGLF